MSYLLDKKLKQKRIFYIVTLVIIFFVIFYFRVGVFRILSVSVHNVFRPVVFVVNGTKNIFSDIGINFRFKSSLIKENENLKARLLEQEGMILNHNSILDENNYLKDVLNRKNEKDNLLLAAILEKPNRSLYDTLIIDVGEDDGVSVGNLVFANGDLPIGRVSEIYGNSSKVVLFSSSGEKNSVVVNGSDVFMDLVGRGGGNFEMILPRDFVLEKGISVSIPGISNYLVAKVDAIISDPRDSFTKALLSSPVNIQESKFVQVKINL